MNTTKCIHVCCIKIYIKKWCNQAIENFKNLFQQIIHMKQIMFRIHNIAMERTKRIVKRIDTILFHTHRYNSYLFQRNKLICKSYRNWSKFWRLPINMNAIFCNYHIHYISCCKNNWSSLFSYYENKGKAYNAITHHQ